jgi:hypothetical protein
MAKIGTAIVEVKTVVNDEALAASTERIRKAVAASVEAGLTREPPCRYCGSLDHTSASGHPGIVAPPSPGMGRDHDRAILEGAEETPRRVVVVRCPHTIGLCYLEDFGGDDYDLLGNLPCPCNERSEIVGEVVEVARS